MNVQETPYIIELGKVGSPNLGYLTMIQNSMMPFEVKRVYWTYYTPDDVIRGHHAHHDLQQIIFSVSGEIEFTLENLNGTKETYVLNKPNIGLYIPKLHWRTIKFSHNAVLLCLASQEYIAEDYIREYNQFKSLGRLNIDTDE